MAATQVTLHDIELSRTVIDRLTDQAAVRGMSLINYVKQVLTKQAEPSQNPSPSGDPWYDVPENLAIAREAVAEYKRNKDRKGVITFNSKEEIRQFFKDLENGI